MQAKRGRIVVVEEIQKKAYQLQMYVTLYLHTL